MWITSWAFLDLFQIQGRFVHLDRWRLDRGLYCTRVCILSESEESYYITKDHKNFSFCEQTLHEGLIDTIGKTHA
jgi:hypothetical protein